MFTKKIDQTEWQLTIFQYFNYIFKGYNFSYHFLYDKISVLVTDLGVPAMNMHEFRIQPPTRLLTKCMSYFQSWSRYLRQSDTSQTNILDRHLVNILSTRLSFILRAHTVKRDHLGDLLIVYNTLMLICIFRTGTKGPRPGTSSTTLPLLVSSNWYEVIKPRVIHWTLGDVAIFLQVK